jgi:hypothetical protein
MTHVLGRSGLLIAVALATGGGPRTLAAQTPFEGTLTMHINGDDGTPHDLRYLMKGGKVRFEVTEGGQTAVVIMDRPNQRMLVLVAEQKIYVESPLAPAVAVGPQRTQGAAQTPAVSMTGRLETIAGYSCEHALFAEADGQQVDVCLARGLGGFVFPPKGNPMAPAAGRPANDWSARLDDGVFPLKVTKAGRVQLEVTNIEKQSLDASLFTPPEGWQKLAGMPGMPGLMRPPQR